VTTAPDPRRIAARALRYPQSATPTLLAICALGALLRFATLNVQSFDYDESFTVGVDLSGSLGHLFHVLPSTESVPPLYFTLAWLWTRVFGLSAVGVRSLSALLGTALIPAAFFIARRLGSQRAGLFAALLIAVNPLQVWYSQEARTYALLALLSALSFWAFIRALDQPHASRMAAWAVVSAAAILSHYFAGFLVAPEAVWLVYATRRRSAIIATGAVAAVGVALIPLIISQTGPRTGWIAEIAFWSRIKEVVKASVSGAIAPTGNWELAVVALPVGVAIIYAASRLTRRERRGVILAAGAGGAALVIPLVLDVGGLHYLISKNVMPALTVLLIAAALILAATRAGRVGTAGAILASVFFLAVTLDDAVNAKLQRPDYRAVAKVLGPPTPTQVVVTPNLGNMPVALYRPGSAYVPPAGWLTSQVVVVEPVSRINESNHGPITPPAPPGFALEGTETARTYTLVCFGSPMPRLATPSVLLALVGSAGGSSAQIWPKAPASAAADTEARSLCAS
jgi:mannosyltransferase